MQDEKKSTRSTRSRRRQEKKDLDVLLVFFVLIEIKIEILDFFRKNLLPPRNFFVLLQNQQAWNISPPERISS